MADEKLPIKYFATRETDILRTEGSGNSEVPKWVLEGDELVKRAGELQSKFDKLSLEITTRLEKDSLIPYVFIAKLCDGATAKSKRKDSSSLFQNSNKSSVNGLIDSNKLMVEINSIAHMNIIANRLQEYNQNSYAISCLETFLEFKPSVVRINDLYSSKIKLINFQDYEINKKMQCLFENTLKTKKIQYKKSLYSKSLPIYKIEMEPETILDSLKGDKVYEILFSIESMPKYYVSIDSASDQNKITIMEPIDVQHYETLGILDNGIMPIPHLKPWLAAERWTVYPETLIDPTHGTFVAGVALYGDFLEGKDWVGHNGIKLLDATIFPKETEGLEEDELIENIREAIEANHEKVKVWNLSISVTRQVSDNKFSDFAIALDEFQEKYNVLICKSAGNCLNFMSGEPKERINEGADSVRSLVVGSMAHEKRLYDFAEIDNPSPFSRCGPGPEYIIKPEISHYGGNAGVDKNGNLVWTGVKSFSKDGNISSDVGTSFSTPRIAALATGLYQEINEDFNPLLLKSLIIHSASYSENLKIIRNERTRELGFGIPSNISNILYNKPYEATIILRDNLKKGERIDIMDFPMPKSLIKDGYYTGQIIATLVYNPILDSSQGIEYCQSNIDLKLGTYSNKKKRDTTKRNILNPVGREGTQNLFLNTLYSKKLTKKNEGEFALRERLLIKYADKYYPVKKYAVDLSELSDVNKKHVAKEKYWYLSLTGLYREFTEQQARKEELDLNQNFCLVITIRDPEKKANIYDEVTQQLNINNFWNSNIEISTDINISI